ncbi:hypothetical protein Tco_1107602 [Tanacetum coccineum]
MAIKEVRGESVMKWKTKVTTKEGIIIKFPGKFRGYKLATEEEVEENEGLKDFAANYIYFMLLGLVLDIAGWLVSATSHLVSAGSLHSCWCNNENRRQKSFFYLKELLPHVYREDLLLLRRWMNRYFRLNPDVDVGLDLWRDVNLLCQSLHSDDVEDFWRTQDEWVVSSWKLYPKSSVHVLDLTNGKTVYMFVDKVYPIRATLLERMLRHRLTVPPSYCRDVVVAGSVIQTIQAGLRESYECLASAPIACTARQMVFSSPWLTAKKESGSPLQRLWLCNFKSIVFLHTKRCEEKKFKLLHILECELLFSQ